MNDETISAALDCAVAAAEAAAQGTFVIWNEMAPDGQQDWLASRATNWPRLDRFLPALLVAVERILADEAAERDRELEAAAARQRELEG